MKLTDMKRSKKERDDMNKPLKAGPIGDDYGHGLSVRLDKHHLKKLGLKPHSFGAGDEVELHGKGIVKTIRQSEGDGFDDSHVEIQLQHLGLAPGSARAAISKGISDADGDE